MSSARNLPRRPIWCRVGFLCLLGIGAVALPGCVFRSPANPANQLTTDPLHPASLAAYYEMSKGGFNEQLSLELSANGSYTLVHILISCLIEEDGTWPCTFSAEQGTWTMEAGLLILQPQAQTKDFPDSVYFVPIHARRLKPQRVGREDRLIHPEYPDHLILKKVVKSWQSVGESERNASAVPAVP
jgi:hypothetical protein